MTADACTRHSKHLDEQKKLPGCVLAWTHVRWRFPLCNLQSGGAISSYSVAPGDHNQIWSQCHGQERSLEAKLQVEGGGGGGEAAANKYGHENVQYCNFNHTTG